MSVHVSAVFGDRARAAEAVQVLKEHAFSDREFAVIARPDDDEQKEAYGRSIEQEDARTGAWTGSALGAAVGGLAGLMSTVLIPAVPLLVVGGAAIGGLAGRGLGGLGLAEQQVHSTEQALRAGGVLIVVEEEDSERAELARQVLERTRARTITVATS